MATPRVAHSAFRIPHSVIRNGFTLIELLVVISIIGVLAALAMPVMRNFKPNHTANATRALLDELSHARQLAISQRTTVFMVFVPTNFWNDPNYGAVAIDPAEKAKMDHLLDKQLIGYNFVSLRSLGDQPGSPTVRYYGEWKTLPEGAFIALQKFGDFNPPPILTNNPSGTLVVAFPINVFNKTTRIPFPSEFAKQGPRPRVAPYIKLPYVAFDYMGRLVRIQEQTGAILPGNSEIIPLTKGGLLFARDPQTHVAITGLPKVGELPPGNWTNAYNLVAVDWITGRARGIQQEVR